MPDLADILAGLRAQRAIKDKQWGADQVAQGRAEIAKQEADSKAAYEDAAQQMSDRLRINQNLDAGGISPADQTLPLSKILPRR